MNGQNWLTTEELIRNCPDLTEDERELLLGAVSTRGKAKGSLLASAPSLTKHPARWAAWQALCPSAHRIASWSLMFEVRANSEAGKAWKACDAAMKRVGLQRLVNATEPPYRWFCLSSNTNADRENTIARMLIEQPPLWQNWLDGLTEA